MKKLLIAIAIAIGILGVTRMVYGASVFQVFQGGTGATTLTGCLTGNGTGPITGTGAACGSGGSNSFSFPFNVYGTHLSTSTTIGFFNGLYSTASSTFSNDLFLTSLGQGLLYNGTNSKVNAVATGTVANGNGITVTAGQSVIGSGLTITNTGLLDLKQTYGGLRTGNIILASSTLVLNGQTLGVAIDNNGGNTFTFTPTLSGTLGVAGGGTGASTLTGCLTGNGTGAITGTGSACGTGGSNSFAWPFTAFTNYVATGTAVDFIAGLFSPASTTFSGPLHLPAITSSFLSTDSLGNVYGAATSSIKTSQLTNDAGFTTNTGDITSVGDVASGAAFDGTQGHLLTFFDSGTTNTATLNFNGTNFAFNDDLTAQSLTDSFLTLDGCVSSVGGLLTTNGAACGSGSATYPISSVITSNASGALIATGTQLTIGNLLATTTATSTFVGAVRHGITAAARDNLIQVDCSGRVYPASVSIGGCVNIDGGTVNAGTLLNVRGNFGSGATGRGIVFNQTNSAFDQDWIVASSSAANTTVLDLQGAPTGKGVLKIEHTGNITDSNANSSGMSIDLKACGSCQGFFIDSTLASTTGNLANFRNKGTQYFTIDSFGKTGIGTSTPFAQLSVRSDNVATTTLAVYPYPGQTADLLQVDTSKLVVKSDGKVGVGTLNPAELLHVSAPTGSFTTFRLDSGATQGYMWSYDGDNSVNVGSNSTSQVNFKMGNATRMYIDNQGFPYVQNSTGNHSWLTVDAPSADPQEATFTNRIGTSANGRFTDYTIENYGTDLLSTINVAKTGTGTLVPFGIRFWNADVANIAANGYFTFLTDPSGATAIGTFSSTTYSKLIPLQIASSTASTTLKVDSTIGTWHLYTSGTGFGTTTLSGLSVVGSATSTSNVGVNLTSGCYAISGTCISGGTGAGSVTSVGLSLPTGFNVTNSPVTTSGTLTAAFSSPAFSIAKIPSYVVAIAGGDFTTIQGALDRCGTDGGGNIYLLDASYAQAGTGLTFKGSNCHVIGRGVGTTTITLTGATTGFKTNSAAGKYSNNSVENLTMTGDGTAAGIAIDISDMNHGVYEHLKIDNFDTVFQWKDTQNTTFYNTIRDTTGTTIGSFGVNASSTNPTNDNMVENSFFGCKSATTNGCIGININNAQANSFYNVTVEPAGNSKTQCVQIRSSSLASNNGTFSNIFYNFYCEGNALGIEASSTANRSGLAPVFGNNFYGGQVEANTQNYACESADCSEIEFSGTGINFVNKNISGPQTILAKNLGPMLSLNDQGFSDIPLSIWNNTNFAHTSNTIAEIGQLNVTDNSTMLALYNKGIGDYILATSSTAGIGFKLTSNTVMGIGTSTLTTAPGKLIIATTTTAQITLQGETGQMPWNLRSVGGNFYLATSSATTQATSTNSAFIIDKNAQVYFPTTVTTGTANTGAWCYNASSQLIRESAVCTVSALKYKKNVQNLDLGLPDLLKLRPVTYYKKDPLDEQDSHQQMGLIADEVAKNPQLNEMLVTYSGGEIQGFRYDQFTALLTKSIQDLNAKVEALPQYAAKVKRSGEENWQWIAIGLLAFMIGFQQLQIKRLKK